jgi:hypothetical protein
MRTLVATLKVANVAGIIPGIRCMITNCDAQYVVKKTWKQHVSVIARLKLESVKNLPDTTTQANHLDL